MDENNNKLEELAEEVKDELEEAEKAVEEAPEEAKDVLNDVINQVKEKFGSLKQAVADIDLNKDGLKLGEQLGKFSEQVSQKIDEAGKKLEGYKEDDKIQEAWASTKDKLTKLSNTVIEKGKEAYNSFTRSEKVEEAVDETAAKVDDALNDIKEKGAEIYEGSNPNIKKAVDTVVEKSKEAGSYISDKYNEFVHNESVRKVVVSARDNIVYFADMLANSVKDILPVEEEEKEEETEE